MNNTKEHSIYFGNDIKPDTIFTVLCKRYKIYKYDVIKLNTKYKVLPKRNIINVLELLNITFHRCFDELCFRNIVNDHEHCDNTKSETCYHRYSLKLGINMDYYNCWYCHDSITILDYWNTKDKETHVKYFRENIWEDMMQTFWNPTKTWCKYFMEYDE
jgi:hypothetical protein